MAASVTPLPDVRPVHLVDRRGRDRSVSELTTLVHLCLMVVDARRPAAARALAPVVARIDRVLAGSDCVVGALVVGAPPEVAPDVVGDRRLVVFADPDGTAAGALGATEAPALLWVTPLPAVRRVVPGWDPPAWRAVLAELARALAWTRPLVPVPDDPPPFPAEPVAGVRRAAPQEDVHAAPTAA